MVNIALLDTGVLLFNPLNAALIAQFGWRDTLRIYSVPLIIIGISLSLLFSPKERVKSELVPLTTRDYLDDDGAHEEKESYSFRTILSYISCRGLSERPQIFLWYFGTFLISMGYALPLFNLVIIFTCMVSAK